MGHAPACYFAETNTGINMRDTPSRPLFPATIFCHDSKIASAIDSSGWIL
jgi:hypothetical protein